VLAQGIGRILTQKSHDQNCTVLAGMSKDFEVHLSLTLNFSYETETLRQINYTVLGKGCIISIICLKSQSITTSNKKTKKFKYNYFIYTKKSIQTKNHINKCVGLFV